MDQDNLSLDFLLQETLALSEMIRESRLEKIKEDTQRVDELSVSNGLVAPQVVNQPQITKLNAIPECLSVETLQQVSFNTDEVSSIDSVQKLQAENLATHSEFNLSEEEQNYLEDVIEINPPSALENEVEFVSQKELNTEAYLKPEVITQEKEHGFIKDIFAPVTNKIIYPQRPGIIYKIDSSFGTFCVRGFSSENISSDFKDLNKQNSKKKSLLKLQLEDDLSEVKFFETKYFELAQAIKNQIINRRFPHQEDSVCNISDPGFSWWMDPGELDSQGNYIGRFEIFFKAHSINRMDKCIQLGPIGDPSIVAQRMNQARNLLKGSFPISEYSCDDKSFSVSSDKPDHLSFLAFKNIFLKGDNNTELENFPEDEIGKTLYFYFHELATVRKFWIEVKSSLS